LQTHELPAQVLTGLPTQLLIRRPDIRQAEYDLQAANVDVDVARAEFLPSLILSGYLGLNSFRVATLVNPASIAIGL
jgi:outer membrane protein TolC